MPASEVNQISPVSNDIKKLAIIAGGGDIPNALAKACERKGIDVFVVAFQDQTNRAVLDGREYMMTSLGSAGSIIKTLKRHEIKDLVLIGKIRRPSLSELKPDLKTAEFFARIGLKALGDNDILELLKDELHREGFVVHGAQSFMGDLTAKEGLYSKAKPSKKFTDDIRRGVEVSQALGQLDIGQSVIVQQGLVIGVEGIEGTDSLIQRSKAYLRKGRGGILVKTCKPQQDKTLDLPTIGPDTIMNAAQNGLEGIVVEAGNALIFDPDKVEELANKHKLFVSAIKLTDYQ